MGQNISTGWGQAGKNRIINIESGVMEISYWKDKKSCFSKISIGYDNFTRVVWSHS